MDINVGVSYKTRGGDIATITSDVSQFCRLFKLKGYVKSAAGEMIRSICMWDIYGNYLPDGCSDFDIIENFEQQLNK